MGKLWRTIFHGVYIDTFCVYLISINLDVFYCLFHPPYTCARTHTRACVWHTHTHTHTNNLRRWQCQ